MTIHKIKIDSLDERATALGMSSDRYYSMKESIEKNGVKVPIIMDKKHNRVLDGMHRCYVCKSIGIEEIPAVYVSMSNHSMDSIRKLAKKLDKKFNI